jgi:polyribonucleotide nucleotidyltransferase
MERKFTLPEFGLEVTLGKYAQQADGAVWIQQGGTVVLSTAVESAPDEFPGFLPLSVDYRENFAAAGRIPGGYFKREGKPSDKDVLVSRLIDRSIRPMFPKSYFNTLQVISSVYSVDKKALPSTLALLSASLALTVSKIPFLGPIGATEVVRIDGKFVVNPTYPETQQSDVGLVVAGTMEGVCMIEGSCYQLSEEELIEAMFLAHEVIKKQIAWQLEIQKEVGVAKEEPPHYFDWNVWKAHAESFLSPEAISVLYKASKTERGAAMDELKKSFIETFSEEAAKVEVSLKALDYVFNDVLAEVLTEEIIKREKRVDGRAFDEIRSIESEVGLLPFNHGSALFTRGRTQALVSCTLGGGTDEQRIEDILTDSYESAFMLHYNFPPFSVGEARFLRGPGRREIGHGYLAASAIRQVLPDKTAFPYTIRLVADMLESDGSTSMATVCGSTLALMDAGVPIREMVSGIAMGLLMSKDGRFQALSDIAGIEDAFGMMDFKVTGTKDGITAIQMDIKAKVGLAREVFVKALAQAKKGRAHILAEMRKCMTAPRAELSDLVPKVIVLKVPTEKIGAIIGSGGKTIKEIILKTGTDINIEDDGTVKIFGQPGPKLDMAVNYVNTLSGHIERGTFYEGPIKKVAEFGIFVELAPGVDGLVHVSNMPRSMAQDLAKTMHTGDIVKVEVVDYDPSTSRIRLKLIQ